MRATVVDREEVLHVARLARLALSEDELEPMARELSAVLDHIAKIGELDLADVPPTTHVVEITGRLRPDEPAGACPARSSSRRPPPSATRAFSSQALRHESG